MGPEIVGPLIAAAVSVVMWFGNRNAKQIDYGFTKLNTTIEKIDDRINDVDHKVDDLRDDVAKNYVSNARFEDHLDLQSVMHAKVAEELSNLREENKERTSEYRKHSEGLRNDISDIKEMQWKTRLGLLDLIDRKVGRQHPNFEDDVWEIKETKEE